jgi:hypothetical protein
MMLCSGTNLAFTVSVLGNSKHHKNTSKLLLPVTSVAAMHGPTSVCAFFLNILSVIGLCIFYAFMLLSANFSLAFFIP